MPTTHTLRNKVAFRSAREDGDNHIDDLHVGFLRGDILERSGLPDNLVLVSMTHNASAGGDEWLWKLEFVDYHATEHDLKAYNEAMEKLKKEIAKPTKPWRMIKPTRFSQGNIEWTRNKPQREPEEEPPKKMRKGDDVGEIWTEKDQFALDTLHERLFPAGCPMEPQHIDPQEKQSMERKLRALQTKKAKCKGQGPGFNSE